ncbi:MAG: hypothetical protein PHX44_01185 [Sulfurimonas sp.]|uniref:hypothetical protein n=1 Tax=Sulfurimonas sp. TaxID=2022749 RepID=UPI002606F4B9|nr:hypothetical protein [Sulfurimonas sp.]MDD2651647.1 hypothetical protein [Sulfurimonas sp.]MDD3451458.1 hypothetical protein [Sulfurimonas sp.]
MKKETHKEIGKYFLDISKILIALALVPPMLKNEPISFLAVGLILVLIGIGIVFTNKGAKDE